MSNIQKIDTHFIRDQFCSVHIVKSDDGYTLVEAGSTLSVPPVVQYCQEHNITPEQIKRVLITHVHLDHSGGSGLLLKEFPQAILYTHSAGVQHIVDPHAKLVPGAVEVYGQTVFDQDYPGIIGTDATRVVGCKEGDKIGDFIFYEAHGHAFHHCMFLYVPDGVLFTGDALGFGFKELNMCPLLCTSPTQYDSIAWRNTINKVRELEIKAIQPTHFYQFPGEDKTKVLESAERQLNNYDRLIATIDNKDDLKKAYLQVIEEELKHFNCISVEKAYELIIGDVNVAGLWYRIQRRLAKQKK